jgi:hypothetical protein
MVVLPGRSASCLLCLVLQLKQQPLNRLELGLQLLSHQMVAAHAVQSQCYCCRPPEGHKVSCMVSPSHHTGVHQHMRPAGDALPTQRGAGPWFESPGAPRSLQLASASALGGGGWARLLCLRLAGLASPCHFRLPMSASRGRHIIPLRRSAAYTRFSRRHLLVGITYILIIRLNILSPSLTYFLHNTTVADINFSSPSGTSS